MEVFVCVRPSVTIAVPTLEFGQYTRTVNVSSMINEVNAAS